MVDVEDFIQFSKDAGKALKELIAAMQTQEASEPAHLERLMIEEKNMDSEDAETVEPKSDEELAVVMEAHKRASPFALDVKAAESKFMEAMKQ